MLLGPADLSPQLVRYTLRGGYDEVEGWLEPGALSALIVFDLAQRRLAARGGVVQVGVHHGRCFLALCMMCRDDERALAIDPFEDTKTDEGELEADSGQRDRACLEHALDEFLDTRDGVIIEQANSLATGADRIRTLLAGGDARLYCIDGCRGEEETVRNLRLARDVLSPQGIIALADYDHPHFEGVTRGADRFLDSPDGGGLEPIASANNKLFIARRNYADRYRMAFEEIVRLGCGTGMRRPLHGCSVWFGSADVPKTLLTPQAWRELLGEDRGLLTAIGASTLPAHHQLIRGWGAPEDWGAWTIGPRATLRLNRPAACSGPLRLEVSLHAFLSGQALGQRVTVSVNEKALGSWHFDADAPTERSVEIPEEVVDLGVDLTVAFDIAHPCSPRELGLSDDRRKLGVGVHRVRLASAAG